MVKRCNGKTITRAQAHLLGLFLVTRHILLAAND